MFETQLNGPDRLDISISGKVDSNTMRESLDALDSQSKGFVNGRMLYRIDNFDMPSFGAIAVELSRLPMLFDLLRRFDRVAVLTEKRWLQKLSELEGKFLPGLSIKAFDANEVDLAEQWLATSSTREER
ncbi:STAS/SEC14 domain-containing protein [Granulosicoccus antarcticus]|nr:STAS/SEC14 domain-containing protein [Granulosicoccus antarcticus]